MKKPEAIVIGTSAGGLFALLELLSDLPSNYRIPIILVQHRSKEPKDLLEEVLQNRCQIKIKQADEKEKVVAGQVYMAPPGYHLLVESDFSLSLSSDERIEFSRPSINVLFESAAIAYKSGLMGILLTGANKDGASGLLEIKEKGGFTIAQSPSEAAYPVMPRAAIDLNAAIKIMPLKEIRLLLHSFIKA